MKQNLQNYKSSKKKLNKKGSFTSSTTGRSEFVTALERSVPAGDL